MPGSELVTYPSWPGLPSQGLSQGGGAPAMPVLSSRGQAEDRASEACDRSASCSSRMFSSTFGVMALCSVFSLSHVFRAS